ncbi:MAG: helix-turn-helix domain-containing protein [Elusimicrobia bacterium]|nr:helix-turn-helix domain-containing protein [Elusimicrobiota bacterium]
MHRRYAEVMRMLFRERELGTLNSSDLEAVDCYIKAVFPFIEEFEKKEFPTKDPSPEQVMRFFMDQQGLSQYDLAKELGGQPVVSNVLRGKRKLNRRQIERLAKRFGVSPAAFYPA